VWCEEGVEVVKGHFVVFKDCKHQSEPQQGELSSYELPLLLSQLSRVLSYQFRDNAKLRGH